MKIKLINPVDTYALRHQILRANQPIESCRYDGDEKEETFHLGAYIDGNLVSIASFYQEKSKLLQEGLQYRLRGMATLEEYRGKGVGSRLIYYAEALLKEREVDLWWCNARVSASRFYEKLGMRQYGEVFDIVPIGPHKLMVKKLR